MLSLTRKTDYALVALAGLAQDGNAPASAHELADRLRLPLPALRNILKVLARNELLISTKGSQGGYRLARPADQITLGEIVHAVEGPVRLAMCCGTSEGGQAQECFRENSCRIKASVRKVHRHVVDVLERVTLADIATDQVPDVLPTAVRHISGSGNGRRSDKVIETKSLSGSNAT